MTKVLVCQYDKLNFQSNCQFLSLNIMICRLAQPLLIYSRNAKCYRDK